MQNIIPNTLVEKIEGNFEGYSISKMSPSDKQFLWETLKRIQPKRCLEVGIYTGGSSAIILEAIKNTKDSILFANDICPTHPFLKDRKPGLIIEEKFPELSSKYHTFIGKDISEYIEEIGGQFDFALIDTAHYHPCECLNLLTILPFMKENSWVVLHDIGQFYCRQGQFDGHNCYATKYIWDAWVGEKVSSEKCEFFTLPNIGAIKIENIEENKRKLISLLFNKWDMEITEEVIIAVRKIIEKYYDKADLEYFDLIIKRRKEIEQGLNIGESMQSSIQRIKKYGPFEKRVSKNGRRRIYFCGMKIFSYKKASPEIVIHATKANIYTADFYRKKAEKGYNSGKIVFNYLQNYYNFDSVIDIGCGIGTWLKAAQDLGVTRIKGFDINEVPEEHLYVQRKNISVVDFDFDSIKGNKEFDLAISLEVGEHLEESSSENFVNTLTSYSDVVLFSAAIPHQGGTNHINCKPLSFWVELFDKENYVCFDFIRKELMDYDDIVSPWYIQNILLFVHQEKKHILLNKNLKENQNPTMFYHVHFVNHIIRTLGDKLCQVK